MIRIGEKSTVREVEGRRQEALAAAKRCVAALRRRFGARRVIPFGSLVEDGAWHGGSDLDLAVEGLSSKALWAAERHLERLAPPWLEVDLVPLERVGPGVRARILGEKPMPESPYLALKVRLEDELAALERVVQGMDAALKRVGEEPDEFDTRALSSYVEDFYTGCEHICERVAVALDGGLPQGEGWYRALLAQMGEPGDNGRPPLLSGSLLLELDAYRRFRHRVRHLYGYALETERVLSLTRNVKPIYVRVREAVEAFGGWLEGTQERTGERG